MKAKGRLFWAALFILCAAGVGYLVYDMLPQKARQGDTPTRRPALPPPQGKPDYRRLLPRKARTADMVFIGKTVCSLRRSVALPSGGTMSSLNVQAGQAVRKGDVLAVYRPDADTGFQGSVASQTETLGLLLEELLRQLDEVETRIRTLRAKQAGPATKGKELIDIERQARALEEEAKLLLKRMGRVEPGNTPEPTAADPHPTASDEAMRVQEETAITSPIDGHVLWVDPEVRAGARCAAADPAFIVGVMDPMLVRSQVYEEEALRLALGDRAALQPESLHPRKFQASVSRISWTPLSLDPVQPSYYEVEFTAANPELALREGMRVIIHLHKPLKPASPVSREQKTTTVTGD